MPVLAGLVAGIEALRAKEDQCYLLTRPFSAASCGCSLQAASLINQTHVRGGIAAVLVLLGVAQETWWPLIEVA